jgi:hypothetical protein
MKTSAIVYTSLIIGGAVTLLSIIPISNCFCCIWVLLGGLFAVPLYQAFDKEKKVLDIGQGILLGVFCGLVAAVFVTILNTILSHFFAAASVSLINSILSNIPDMAEFYDQIPLYDLVQPGAFTISAFVTSFFLNSVIFVVFGLLGGMIGSAAFKKQ